MGSSISKTETTIANNYNLANSTLDTTGNQSVGSASSKATTDVSPKTDMNFSTGVNPSWWGNLVSAGQNAARRIMGTVGNNSDIIQTFKHIGATALRVAMGDGSLKDKATKMVTNMLNSSTPEGSLTSTEQVPMDNIAEAADMQVAVINRLAPVHDAYGTVALGSTGMRNKEVTTQPTSQSLLACYNRATPVEQANASNIIAAVGPRLGVIPKNETTPPSSLVIDTFNNAQTQYGRVEKVKQDGEQIAKQQNDMLFSIMHSSGPELASAGILRPANWETPQVIGSIKQDTMPVTAAAYPNGHQFAPKDLIGTTSPFIDVETGKTFDTCALSVYAYSLPEVDPSRIVRLILSGQITIVNQPFTPDVPIKVGMLYSRADGKCYFNSAIFINTNYNSKAAPKALDRAGKLLTDGATNVFSDDVDKYAIYDRRGVITRDSVSTARRANNVGQLMADRDNLGADPVTFSYSSQWQVVVNLSNCIPIDPLLIFKVPGWASMGKFSAALVAIYPNNLTMALAVQVPSLNITVVRIPRTMRYIGKEYNGTICELLGAVPDWYATQDPHDPWAIYYKLMTPLINLAGKIAFLHVNSGAAYQLTCDHVINARVASGLPALDNDDLKAHIIDLITDIAKWLSTAGPVAKYIPECRKRLLMHIVQKVMLQSMTHISVYTSDYSKLALNYLRDCDAQNAYERSMDSARNSNA